MEYYYTTTKGRWIGEVEATDADAAGIPVDQYVSV